MKVGKIENAEVTGWSSLPQCLLISCPCLPNLTKNILKKEEEKNMKILFYEAGYNEGFGSIFPSVDICSLIPDEEADVAILEEPEHLNWLRSPKRYKESPDEIDARKKEKKARKHKKNKKKIRHVPTAKERAECGWRFKFRHAVGIM